MANCLLLPVSIVALRWRFRLRFNLHTFFIYCGKFDWFHSWISNRLNAVLSKMYKSLLPKSLVWRIHYKYKGLNSNWQHVSTLQKNLLSMLTISSKFYGSLSMPVFLTCYKFINKNYFIKIKPYGFLTVYSIIWLYFKYK